MSKLPPVYSPAEERTNVWTHAAGAVIALAGVVGAFFIAPPSGVAGTAGYLVYGVSLVLMYLGQRLLSRSFGAVPPGAAAPLRSCGDLSSDRRDLYAGAVAGGRRQARCVGCWPRSGRWRRQGLR